MLLMGISMLLTRSLRHYSVVSTYRYFGTKSDDYFAQSQKILGENATSELIFKVSAALMKNEMELNHSVAMNQIYIDYKQKSIVASYQRSLGVASQRYALYSHQLSVVLLSKSIFIT